MPVRDSLLAVVVMVIWGANFVVIEAGLDGVPPLVFVAVRFVLVVLPAVFFVPRPNAGWRQVALVGLLMSAGQFGFMYSSLAAGMPPGLASLVLQIQAAFTVVFAAVALHERPMRHQLVGIGIGLAGLLTVALGRGGGTPVGALLLCLGAAACWGAGNVASRRVGASSGLSMTVWSGVVVPVPLFVLSLAVYGPAEVWAGLAGFSLVNWLSTAYTAVLASLVGYGVWNSLLARHPASTVAPFSLLVPPVGIATAWLVRGEVPTVAVLVGGAVLMLGVAWTNFGSRFAARRAARAAPAQA